MFVPSACLDKKMILSIKCGIAKACFFLPVEHRVRHLLVDFDRAEVADIDQQERSQQGQHDEQQRQADENAEKSPDPAATLIRVRPVSDVRILPHLRGLRKNGRGDYIGHGGHGGHGRQLGADRGACACL
jgi:hypothetical protein